MTDTISELRPRCEVCCDPGSDHAGKPLCWRHAPARVDPLDTLTATVAALTARVEALERRLTPNYMDAIRGIDARESAADVARAEALQRQLALQFVSHVGHSTFAAPPDLAALAARESALRPDEPILHDPRD